MSKIKWIFARRCKEKWIKRQLCKLLQGSFQTRLLVTAFLFTYASLCIHQTKNTKDNRWGFPCFHSIAVKVKSSIISWQRIFPWPWLRRFIMLRNTWRITYASLHLHARQESVSIIFAESSSSTPGWLPWVSSYAWEYRGPRNFCEETMLPYPWLPLKPDSKNAGASAGNSKNSKASPLPPTGLHSQRNQPPDTISVRAISDTR